MGKKHLYEQARVYRNRAVQHTLGSLASDAANDVRIDGSMTILSIDKRVEFYASGILMDRPNDLYAALGVLMDRVRRQIDEQITATD